MLTETALLQFTEKKGTSTIKKICIFLSLCDLTTAFNSISHILIDKLANKHRLLLVYESCQIEFSPSVLRTHTSKLEIPFDAPQGLILGTILCTIYANDMAKNVDGCKLMQYAYDAQFFTH